MHVLWIVLSYVLGSIPCGLVIAKCCCNVDPRTGGSRNVGSTNVARLCGKKWGTYTLICDILKGFVPVAVAVYFSDNMFFVSCTAAAAVLGHVFSCFMFFEGGKAVATSIGVFLALAFWPLLCSVILCLACIRYSGFVSLGSLALVLSLPIFLLIGGYFSLIPLALGVMALVIWKHATNIQRLLNGTEKSWKKSA